MSLPDFEQRPTPEDEASNRAPDIHRILKDDYGLRLHTPRKWFSKAIGSLEEGATFEMAIIPRKLSDSPLFADLARSAAEHEHEGPEEGSSLPIELIAEITKEEILPPEIPQTEKNQLLAELPERIKALQERMTNFPQRKWKSEEEYLEALQAQRRHIKVWMTLLTEHEPMLILQVVDTSEPSLVADFRHVILRSYYGPGSPLFDSLVDWIQQARELSGMDRSEKLDQIMASHNEAEGPAS